MTILDAQANLRTLRDVLRFAVSRFSEAGLMFGHGQADAFEEAAFIVMRMLKLPHERLEFFADAYLTHAEINALLQTIDRRVKKRVPAAYLLNEAWLQGYKFFVDERAIVPRSFIAELLPNGLAPWVKDANKIADVLDLCTGSGCLAVLAAEAFPTPRSTLQTSRPMHSRSRAATSMTTNLQRAYRCSSPICLRTSPPNGMT